MMNNTPYVVEQLQRLLETFQAMPTLPLPGAPEALADHAGWMQTHEDIERLEMETYFTALLALPPDIWALYETVDSERCRILSIGKFYRERPNQVIAAKRPALECSQEEAESLDHLYPGVEA